MSEAKELVTIDDISEANAPAIYVKGGLLQFLEAVKVEVTAEVPDLTPRNGRDRIASLAAKVSKAWEEAEAKARKADRAHKGATLKAAKEAIMKAGITEEQAKAVVKMIAAGKVPNVEISY